jgi:hypothetical protein
MLAPMAYERWSELVKHLTLTTPLPAAAATRVVEEVVAYFNESTEGFVRRRHRELQTTGLANAEIFRLVAAELVARPVAAPELSERQIRRLVYG